MGGGGALEYWIIQCERFVYRNYKRLLKKINEAPVSAKTSHVHGLEDIIVHAI